MIKYLPDTNIISEWMKPVPDPSVIRKIKYHRNECATAAPVWHELLYGCHRLPISRKREQLEFFLKNVIEPHISILPYDERAAQWHSAERARLSLIGLTPSFADGQIAAIAKTKALILVTRNVSDFEIFADLTVENWHDRKSLK